MKITVATLTVDDGNTTLTSAHPTMADAEKCLFDNYDADNQFDGDLQELLDHTGITAYFDTSTIDVPAEVECWIVTYVNDEVADDFGSHVFLTRREADEWIDQYESENTDDEGDGHQRYTTIARHRITAG